MAGVQSKQYFMSDIRTFDTFDQVLKDQLKDASFANGEGVKAKIDESKSKLKERIGSRNYPVGYYVYLLLDPRLLKGDFDFETLVNAVMYVGRGTGDRTLQHWLNLIEERDQLEQKKKYDFLLMLHANDNGYIPAVLNRLLTFEESDVLENALINLFDVSNLLNQKSGSQHCWCENYQELDPYLGLDTLLEFYNQLKECGKPKELTFLDLHSVHF